MKKLQTAGLLHEYSIKPTTFRYRLPSSIKDQYYNSPYSQKSPFTPIFENLSVPPLNGSSTSKFFDFYPLINSKKLQKFKERPTNFKMLSGDFIEDSLYNPNYGYFSKQAEIFQNESPFKYNELKDKDDFIKNWSDQYGHYGEENLQLWHTPTELFQPHYGEAIARYLLVNYKLNLYPYHDLVIYEIGGGNGTLMTNILNFIKVNQPEVYSKTRYKIVEISKNLSHKQKLKSLNHKILESEHTAKVEIINKSILDWDQYVPEPCFVLGMEVLDNLAHDVLKYDIKTGQPYQGYVVIDDLGDFHQFFSPELEQWTQSYLDLSDSLYKNHGFKHPLKKAGLVKSFRNWLSPFNNDLTESEFIPTRLIKLFHVLNKFFPDHQLVLSDFDSLSSRSEGLNSPVVQTVIQKNKMVTASTYMVHQGYFDIMFPTNFTIIRDLYIKICGRLIKNSKHAEFLANWADIEKTTLKSGENLMLEFYSNASFLHS